MTQPKQMQIDALLIRAQALKIKSDGMMCDNMSAAVLGETGPWSGDHFTGLSNDCDEIADKIEALIALIDQPEGCNHEYSYTPESDINDARYCIYCGMRENA